MEKSDLVIIGAGVIGCATARQASIDFPDKKIIVLEKNTLVGLETSGRNSGVLHSGFHHPAGSLKEKLANRGNKLAKEYARLNYIPLLESGMLIVVPKITGITGILKNSGLLKTMYRNSKKQGLKFSILTLAGIKKLEPNVEAVAGIYLPEITVIDQVLFVKSIFADACTRGVNFLFNTAVTTIKLLNRDPKYGTGFVINDKWITRAIINCAGIYADVIANILSKTSYKQYPVRGEYYEVVNNSRIVNRLVYLAVSPDHAGKGIHFGPRPDGSLYLGPSLKPVNHKEDYWHDKIPPEFFLNSVRDFVPGLRLNDLKWAYSGIRTKLSPDKDSDFIIKLDFQNPPMINNVGIDSPGLSSSLAIAEMNCALLTDSLKK